MEDNKYLKLARQAREEDNTEDAKRFYDIIRVENPEDGEARYFYAYYALFEGKISEIKTRFENVCNVIMPSITNLFNSENKEKETIINDIVKSFVPLVSKAAENADEMDYILLYGSKTLCELSDLLETYKFDTLVCFTLKEVISLEFKYILSQDVEVFKKSVKILVSKVKQYDPSYEPPTLNGLARKARKSLLLSAMESYYKRALACDPTNEEAKYFLTDNFDFEKKCKAVIESVNSIAQSDNNDKEESLSLIIEDFIPRTWDAARSQSKVSKTYTNGMKTLYELGNILESYNFFTLACVAWKEAISLQQKFYAYGTKGDPEKYTEKVKKYEPSYEMPKKAGCITIGINQN